MCRKLFAFTGGKVDIHRANECRAISAPLAAIAERQGCALLAVRHLDKSRGGGHALNAGIGSIDFTAAARSMRLVGRDPDDEQKRAVGHIKHNLTPPGEAIGYKLEGGQFFWTGASDLTAERSLALPSDEEERVTGPAQSRWKPSSYFRSRRMPGSSFIAGETGRALCPPDRRGAVSRDGDCRAQNDNAEYQNRSTETRRNGLTSPENLASSKVRVKSKMSLNEFASSVARKICQGERRHYDLWARSVRPC